MPTTVPKADLMSLTERIHALPPELFNRVLDYYLAVDPEEVVKIDRYYKPPVQLQLCRAMRDSYGKIYYVRKFEFALSRVALARWFMRQPPSHCKIRKIVRNCFKGYLNFGTGPPTIDFIPRS